MGEEKMNLGLTSHLFETISYLRIIPKAWWCDDMSKKDASSDFSSVKETCRRAGLRLTHQRMEILHELALSSDHPSAETLHGRLIKRMPALSLDTVYRTLATFNHCGLVQKVETSDSQARFEAVHGYHHHLICRRCHAIIDFVWPGVDGIKLPDAARDWGRVERCNVVISGLCRSCADVENHIGSVTDSKLRTNKGE